MKKGIFLGLAFSISLSLGACGGEDEYSEIAWPTSGIAELLPVPESTYGEIVSNSEDNLYVCVAKTSETDYAEYVEACKANGFIEDYYGNDSTYTAYNEDDVSLYLSYSEDDKEMFISLIALEDDSSEAEGTADTETDETEPSETASQEESEPSESTEVSEESESSDGIRPEFKEAMDSYEEFFDEYCEFMKKYNSSDDPTSMLADYSDYLTKYAEAMTKMSELGDEELSNEELVYYAEVTGRITTKLAEVAQ